MGAVVTREWIAMVRPETQAANRRRNLAMSNALPVVRREARVRGCLGVSTSVHQVAEHEWLCGLDQMATQSKAANCSCDSRRSNCPSEGGQVAAGFGLPLR